MSVEALGMRPIDHSNFKNLSNWDRELVELNLDPATRIGGSRLSAIESWSNARLEELDRLRDHDPYGRNASTAPSA